MNARIHLFRRGVGLEHAVLGTGMSMRVLNENEFVGCQPYQAHLQPYITKITMQHLNLICLYI